MNFIQAYLLLWIMLLCSIVCGWQQDINGINIKVEERSGKIIVSNGINTIKLSFKEIIEVDRFGTAVGLHTSSNLHHSFNNFENTAFSPSRTEVIEIVAQDKNVTAVRKNFTTQLQGPGVVFNFQVLIYDNDTAIPNANMTEYYEIYNGTVQFAFSIIEWPFCGIKGFYCESKSGVVEIGEYLDVYVAIEGLRDKAVLAYHKSQSRSSRKPDTYDYGGSDVTFSHKYFVNNTWLDMEDGYPLITQKDKKNVAIIRFPTFYTTAYYDPMINVSSHVYNTSVKISSSWFSISVIMLIITMNSIYGEE